MAADRPEDRDLFLEAARGARPLRDRERVPTGERTPALPRPARPLLTVDRDGDRIEGRADGVTRAQVAALRGCEPEVTLDLHGRTAKAARGALGELMRNAVATGRRYLLIVHGRGLHSTEGPVLAEAVVTWLVASPHVRAFTSAAPRHGGAGALMVELWRPEGR